MLKKSLSQHLIKDRNVLEKMVKLSGVTGTDAVVEIGPGQGDLTRCLAEEAGRVYAVELDRSFKPRLDALAGQFSNLTVLFADFLEVPLSGFVEQGQVKVVGNIPYGITGPILFKIFAERALVESVHLTVQKEIGQRIVSEPHRRTFGALSVISQLLADVKILFTINPRVFVPPPKVDSVFLSLLFKDEGGWIDDGFMRFVKACFENKRKHMRYALLKILDEDVIESLYSAMGFCGTTRAEELAPEKYEAMYRFLCREHGFSRLLPRTRSRDRRNTEMAGMTDD
jgi:16S rRNA (adenine1518-N6/adenine1519-N6)-dimethyltransferase